MLKKIVLALDRDSDYKPALDIAAAFAYKFQADLLLLGISHTESEQVRELHFSHEDIGSPTTIESLKDNYDGFGTFQFFLPENKNLPLEEIRVNSEEENELGDILEQLQKEVTATGYPHKLPEEAVSWSVVDKHLLAALQELGESGQIDLVVPAWQQPWQPSYKHQISVNSHQVRLILGHAGLPVLVVLPHLSPTLFQELKTEAPTGAFKHPHGSEPHNSHIVLTLDGSKEAEAALPLAAELAVKFNLPIYLLMVLPLNPSRQYFNPETAQPYEIGEDALDQYDFAQTYLSYYQESLMKQGITSHQSILEGNAEERIGEYIERTHPTFTVLATHARSKFEQLFLGSVAERLLSDSPGLLCLVPTRVHLENFPEKEEPSTTGKETSEKVGKA